MYKRSLFIFIFNFLIIYYLDTHLNIQRMHYDKVLLLNPGSSSGRPFSKKLWKNDKKHQCSLFFLVFFANILETWKTTDKRIYKLTSKVTGEEE